MLIVRGEIHTKVEETNFIKFMHNYYKKTDKAVNCAIAMLVGSRPATKFSKMNIEK
jgi:hypothetical protein